MITILFGKIASGKSFRAEKLAQAGAIVLSVDELMSSLYPNCVGREKHLEVTGKIADYLCFIAASISKNGLDVIIDFGFWTKSERESVASRLDSLGAEYRFELIDAPFDTRLKRLEERNERFLELGKPERVIPTSKLEYFDSLFS